MAMLKRNLLVLLALLAGAAAAHAQDVTVKVGMVKSISSVATLTAIEKGYFKEFGIKVETEDLDTSANVIALLAQNRLQVVEGGISAGYFNALEKDLPITMVMDRVSSPLGHHLMLRPDLKEQITRFKDLKGRIIASNGQGSVSTYEVGKMLETDGLTIADVDVKVLPFNQMAIAFTNKAIDAAIVIPPFTSQFLDHGFAVSFKQPDDLVKPWPLTIAVAMINTDWAKPNRELLRNYFTAYLHGVRDYCQAYHGGANRAELIQRLIRTGTETRAELLYEYPWPARDPNGRINVESMLDMQAWYRQNKFSSAQLPAERLADTSFAGYAVQRLGPFVVENQDSKLVGCR
ncbi:MAG TPA: ABC transporter substrate-binding protein [Xanthobacteraceae bacterium]|jgi:NitT/TauT family transport system substrate-binding protein